MNISIKDVNKEDWILIKSEAAKSDLKISEFLNRMLLEYIRQINRESNWNEILYGKKFLNDKDAIKIKEVMKDFRKEFEFR